MEGPDFINTAKESADGVLYVSTNFAAQAYDGLVSLFKAMKNCSYADTECVRNELTKLDFEGASGRIKFDTIKLLRYKSLMDLKGCPL